MRIWLGPLVIMVATMETFRLETADCQPTSFMAGTELELSSRPEHDALMENRGLSRIELPKRW
jgi:hypothetical protein